MELHGPALAKRVEAPPPVKPGRGRAVLATLTHLNSFVQEMSFEGCDAPLQPTDRHRLFSETRQGWVPAVMVQPGEFLRTRTGVAQVRTNRSRQGVRRVYNLEIESEHCYFAGSPGVLSHNENPCAAPLPENPGTPGLTATSAAKEPLLLETSAPTKLSLKQVRALRGDGSWKAGEEYIQELYGSPGQRHFPVPETGGRFVDAPVDVPGGVLASEVKTYRVWRTVEGVAQRQSVPLSEHIREQIARDVYLRGTVQGYDPRWIFLGAPPSADLAGFLADQNIVFLIYH
jgi:hypothetical protein